MPAWKVAALKDPRCVEWLMGFPDQWTDVD